MSDDTYSMNEAVDLFAGAGGASLGLLRSGYIPTGVEIDPDAATTYTAAGMRCLRADVRTLNPHAFPCDHLHASPVCTNFSAAGIGAGRRYLTAIGDDVLRVFDAHHDTLLPSGIVCDDPTSLLTLEPARWIRDMEPVTITMEQVGPVLPIFDAYAVGLRSLGYSTWTGILHCEMYGLPQTRQRAWLIASMVGKAQPPVPTHSRYHPRKPGFLDPGLPRWVSMAEALGWDDQGRTVLSNYSTDGDYSNPGTRRHDEPFATVTSKISRFKVTLDLDLDDEPHVDPDRILDQSGTLFDLAWPWKRPVTTVTGRDRVQHPGKTGHRGSASTKTRNDGLRLTVAEAGVLQGFPADYPWQGNKRPQYQQVGNAVPPPVMEAVLRGLR